MKLLAVSILLWISLFACKNKKNENKIGRNISAVNDTLSKEESTYKRIDRNLQYETEKFGLLSKIYSQNYDTLYSIIREYNFKTSSSTTGNLRFQQDSFKVIQSKAIDSIAKRFKLPKQKVSLLIFAFEYEMITKEEIEENAVEDFKNSLDDKVEGTEVEE